MKVTLKALVLTLAFVGSATLTFSVHAETTAGERVQEGLEDAGKSMKKTGRDIKDKACEMINGKLECVGKKAANKLRNAKDELKDKANDIEKKVD